MVPKPVTEALLVSAPPASVPPDSVTVPAVLFQLAPTFSVLFVATVTAPRLLTKDPRLVAIFRTPLVARMTPRFMFATEFASTPGPLIEERLLTDPLPDSNVSKPPWRAIWPLLMRNELVA